MIVISIFLWSKWRLRVGKQQAQGHTASRAVLLTTPVSVSKVTLQFSYMLKSSQS